MRIPALFALLAAALLGLGGTCSPGEGPQVAVSLHGVADDLDDLLIHAADATVFVQASVAAGSSPVDPASVSVEVLPWDGGPGVPGSVWSSGPTGAVGFVQPPPGGFAPGTWTALVWVSDTNGRTGTGRLDFAIRARAGAPPIGSGQQIWYDFTSDRDAVAGADFPVDLRAFGLGSPLAPALSAQVEQDVIDGVLARVREAYYEEDPSGLGVFDPVAVTFSSQDPGSGDVTRICVGGEDPSGGSSIGAVLIDPNNGNRNGSECGSIPPSGVFPREMLVFQGQQPFVNVFAALMPALGGTPVGEHPLDAAVLDPGFDPGSASGPELARYDAIVAGAQAFADGLGSVVAHETGHALGLVAPGPPGVGLHGGTAGAVFSHDVRADGTTSPSENYLMKHGGTFGFARLAGLAGNPLPWFRPLDFAYLRDRLMTDPSVTELLPPPSVEGVSPATVTTTLEITVSGKGLAATPSLRMLTDGFTYALIGETWVSETQMTAWVNISQVIAGTYDLELRNPDGQVDVLADAVTVP